MGRVLLGPWIGQRTHTFEFGPGWMTQRERWVLCRTRRFGLDPSRLPALRGENVHDLRWWTADQLREAQVVTTPRHLAGLLDEINSGRLPAAGTDLGT